MKKEAVLGFMITLIVVSMLTLAFNIQQVKASGTIYIRADGSVEGTTHITSVDNVTYTFTANIYDSIAVARDNIVVDGAGYILYGTGSGTGIDLSYRTNVTIKNMEIKAFSHGVNMVHASNNTVSGNNITANEYTGIHISDSSHNSISGNSITTIDKEGKINRGIYLTSSSHNSISGNNITNSEYGVYFYQSSNNSISGNNITNNAYGIRLSESSNNIIYHNDFIDNTYHVSIGLFGYANFCDDGYPSGGNYWSDYTSVDADSDGIGDTPYVIDADNQDRYPLMSPWGTTIDENGNGEEEEVPFWMQLWFYVIVAGVIVALIGAVYFLKKRKPPTPTVPTFP